MNGSITVYFNTGFNGIDIPAEPSVLASASKKTYADVYFIREDIDKPAIRIKDSYENLCAVDYCEITTTNNTCYYFASPSAISKGVTMLALDLDALLTMGGAKNLTYISGWQERGHIKKTDDVLFGNVAAEEWIPSQPLKNANMTKVQANASQAANDLHIITTNVDLATLSTLNIDEQEVIKGVESGTARMYFPHIPAAGSTNYSMWDFDDNALHTFAIPQTRAYAVKDFTRSGNPDITRVKQALEKLYSCGQLQLQNSYILPKEFVSAWSLSSLTGDMGGITGFHGDHSLSNMPYEYSITGYTVKNKKVFATYRQYALACVGSGDMIIKEAADLYKTQDSNPTVNMWADPCSTGKPYARFAYIKGAPVQFTDCVKGLQWANNQLVMEGASGSLWNSIDNAFTNQRLQRQQSENLFNSSVAVQQAELRAQGIKNDIHRGSFSGAMGVLGGALSEGPVSNWGSFGKAAANTVVSGSKYLQDQYYNNQSAMLQLQQLQNDINATTSRAEMANNSLQNEINQNNIGLIKSNQIVAPSVSFTPEQNLGLYGYNYFVAFEIRKSDDDLKSEDMYYQRYGYNGLHRPLTGQCFNERTYYNYVQAFDVNLKAPVKEFGIRVRTKAIAQLNKGVRVWKVLPDASYYDSN